MQFMSTQAQLHCLTYTFCIASTATTDISALFNVRSCFPECGKLVKHILCEQRLEILNRSYIHTTYIHLQQRCTQSVLRRITTGALYPSQSLKSRNNGVHPDEKRSLPRHADNPVAKQERHSDDVRLKILVTQKMTKGVSFAPILAHTCSLSPPSSAVLLWNHVFPPM